MARIPTFRGGIHPLHNMHEGKHLSEKRAIVEIPPPKIVSLPMSQHIGAPAKPVVKKGERVLMGQLIGEAQGFVSVPVHASVSGTVIDVKDIIGINGKLVKAVIIENDMMDEKAYMTPSDPKYMKPAEIVARVKDAGIVGMGGAAFPLHVKLSPPEGKIIDTLILNGAECEPFLTADQRVMMEQPEKVVDGAQMIRLALSTIKRVFIGVEDNKPDAIEALKKAAAGTDIEVVTIKTKYPQGSEKQLIDAVTGRQVPSGGLPQDAGVACSNISSCAGASDAFRIGEPLIKRVVTVTGAVRDPQNMLVRLGTSSQELLDIAGGYVGEPLKLISGGPMMGLPIPDPSCVVTKGYSGLLVLDSHFTKNERESNCIRCGKCADVCPIFLYPSLISEAAAGEDFELAESRNAMDCMSCGCCSYICPAKKPLAQNIKFAKDMITVNRMKERQRMEAGENC